MASILVCGADGVNRPAVVGDCAVGPIHGERQPILSARFTRSCPTWTAFWEIGCARKEKGSSVSRCTTAWNCFARWTAQRRVPTTLKRPAPGNGRVEERHCAAGRLRLLTRGAGFADDGAVRSRVLAREVLCGCHVAWRISLILFSKSGRYPRICAIGGGSMKNMGRMAR